VEESKEAMIGITSTEYHVSEEEETKNDLFSFSVSQFGLCTLMYIYAQVYRKPKKLIVC